VSKYGEFWRYDVVDGGFQHPRTGGMVLVFRVSPRVGFGFGRGQSFDSFGCGIITPSGDAVFTTDSHATVSASGVGTLTCTYVK